MNLHKHFISLKQKVHSKDILFSPSLLKKLVTLVLDLASEQIIWLEISPIKWGIRNQVTCSKALLQIGCRESWGRFRTKLQGIGKGCDRLTLQIKHVEGNGCVPKFHW